LSPARPKISKESNRFFIELVCFPEQVLKQCKPLGQSLDHDALVAINKKLEKEPQTRLTLIFADAKSILFTEWPREKEKENRKRCLNRERLWDAALGFSN